MPQMAPYNWLNLFYLFNLIWWMLIIHNHFMTNLKILKIKKLNKFNYNIYTWKW